MRFKTAIYGAALVGATALITSQVVSQDPAQDQMEEMMARWIELGTPGDHHKLLDQFVGTWEQEIKMWMDPSAPPSVETSHASYEWILNGRFLKGSYKGNFDGMPFEGMDLMGYDNYRKAYTGFWMDNMSTQVMIMRGQYDEASKSFVMEGTHDDLLTDRRDVPIKTVNKIVSKDEMIYESWAQGPDGKMFKSMEITSRRQAK